MAWAYWNFNSIVLVNVVNETVIIIELLICNNWNEVSIKWAQNLKNCTKWKRRRNERNRKFIRIFFPRSCQKLRNRLRWAEIRVARLCCLLLSSPCHNISSNRINSFVFRFSHFIGITLACSEVSKNMCTSFSILFAYIHSYLTVEWASDSICFDCVCHITLYTRTRQRNETEQNRIETERKNLAPLGNSSMCLLLNDWGRVTYVRMCVQCALYSTQTYIYIDLDIDW